MEFILHLYIPSTQPRPAQKMHPLAFIGQTKRFDPMSTLVGAILAWGICFTP